MFIAWIEANPGLRPEGRYASGRPVYTLDRFNNNGNYEPGNLRWATQSQQVLNSRHWRISRSRPPAAAQALSELGVPHAQRLH